MKYTIVNAGFVADSSSTTLTFTDTSPNPAFGIVLDSVSVR
jgi:hypothetical protein